MRANRGTKNHELPTKNLYCAIAAPKGVGYLSPLQEILPFSGA